MLNIVRFEGEQEHERTVAGNSSEYTDDTIVFLPSMVSREEARQYYGAAKKMKEPSSNDRGLGSIHPDVARRLREALR